MHSAKATEANPPILKNWHYRTLSLTIMFGVSVFLGLAVWTGWDKMYNALIHIGLPGLGVALFLTLANLGIRLLRWQLYLAVLQIKPPLMSSIRIYIAGLALSITPGKAGELIRGVYLNPFGASYLKSFSLFIADRFTDLIAVLILASSALWINPEARPVGVLLALIVLLLLFSIQFPERYKKMALHLTTWVPWLALSAFILKTVDVIAHCKSLFTFPVFFSALIIALVAWSCEGLSLYIISQLLQADIALTTVLSIYAFSKLIGAISMIPGGMGTTEATLIGLFLYHGVDETTAISCALFLRLTTFWFVTTLGIIALPSGKLSRQ